MVIHCFKGFLFSLFYVTVEFYWFCTEDEPVELFYVKTRRRSTSGVSKRSPVSPCLITAEFPGMFRASTGTPNFIDCQFKTQRDIVNHRLL